MEDYNNRSFMSGSYSLFLFFFLYLLYSCDVVSIHTLFLYLECWESLPLFVWAKPLLFTYAGGRSCSWFRCHLVYVKLSTSVDWSLFLFSAFLTRVYDMTLSSYTRYCLRLLRWVPLRLWVSRAHVLSPRSNILLFAISAWHIHSYPP